MSTELTRMESGAIGHALQARDILAQVRLIQEVMASVMHENEHYGKIPGCGDKPTLLQPGAQKLLMTFRLAPEYEINEKELTNGHREYRVLCTLKSIQSANFVGQGVGCCSTMEGKFRFRVAPKKLTDRPVPKAYWDLKAKDPKAAQQAIGGNGFSVRKNDDGQWMIAEGTSEKVEHDNPADYYNTVLKMAKKRALVDATITATAASDIFTQDIEDMPEVIQQPAKPQRQEPEHREPPAQRTEQPAPAKTADVLPKAATEETRRWMIEQMKGMEQDAIGYAIDAGIILPNEGLEDWPLTKVPTTRSGLTELVGKIEQWTLGKSGLAPEGNGASEAWRAFPVPYGKNAGVPLGELDKKPLYGFWANMTVETEYNGRPKKPETIEKDKVFRAMLDDAGRHYEFTKND